MGKLKFVFWGIINFLKRNFEILNYFFQLKFNNISTFKLQSLIMLVELTQKVTQLLKNNLNKLIKL